MLIYFFQKRVYYLLTLSFLVSICNVYSQTWTEKDESENYTARHEFGFTQVGDKFIMFGGRESSQTLDVYDYTSNSWSEGGLAPVAFNHFQAVTYEGLIWVIGAFKTNQPNPEQNADYIYMYNPVTQQWIQGMEIPESRKRGAAGLAVYNNKFYVVGGNNNGHSGGYVSYFDEFNPITGTWTPLTNAPHERDHFQAVVLDDKLYAIGGRLTGGSGGLFEPQVPEVDVYNFATEQWTTLNSNQNLPYPRSGLGVVVYDNEIYTIGGETTFNRVGNGQVDVVESYNPATNTWTTQSSLNYRRHGIQAIVSGNAIYVAGGSQGGTSIKNMEYYGTDSASLTTNTNSTFATDETTKTFEYDTDDGTATINMLLSNTAGTTGTYIDDIEISGTNFTLAESYNNRFLGADDNLNITAILNDTTNEESNATVTVTYNNNNSLTINLEGTLDTSLSTNSFENTTTTFSLYPTPTQHQFSINQAVSVVEIYNLSGKRIKLFEGTFSKNSKFSISELPASLYIVKAINAEGKPYISKLIKN